jgi:demethylmenaquinone methyltransferase / 2-methoxy-6-polyprenyl-1,4-benzoquinol methylase
VLLVVNRERLVRSFFSETGKSYDKVVQTFTLGLDSYWKEEMLKLVPQSGRILDLGCGTGIVTEYLAKKYPTAEMVGVDITEDYLAVYRERLRNNPWIHAQPILGNAETVSLQGEFDVIVSSYLAKYVDPELLLNNVVSHLRRGGVFIAHDFTLPINPLYVNIWSIYVWGMNQVGSILYPEWHTVFNKGLSDLISKSRWMKEFEEALMEFGFEGVKSRRLSFETAGLVWATKT